MAIRNQPFPHGISQHIGYGRVQILNGKDEMVIKTPLPQGFAPNSECYCLEIPDGVHDVPALLIMNDHVKMIRHETIGHQSHSVGCHGLLQHANDLIAQDIVTEAGLSVPGAEGDGNDRSSKIICRAGQTDSFSPWRWIIHAAIIIHSSNIA